MSSLDKFLLKAVLQGSLDDVSDYIAERASPDAKDSNGRSAIYHAAAEGDEDMVKLLLLHKADVNAPDDDGMMPLTAALEKTYFNIAELLMKNGAKADIPAGDKKMCVLHSAINMDMKDGKAERVQFLLERGADANATPNAKGLTPYEQAKAFVAEYPQAQVIVDAMAAYAEGVEKLAQRKEAEFIASEVKAVFTGAAAPARVKTVRFAAPKGPR